MTPLEVLKTYYGHDKFRGVQEEIITKIINDENVLGVMPTGAGKSVCYQIPSLLKKGTTVVISPLIALMQDQNDTLLEMGINAVAINSTLTETKKRLAYKKLAEGKYEIIFCSPERFRDEVFVDILKNINVSLFVVDEAHCISQWGHSFRIEYTELAKYREMLGNPTTLALTATATPKVQDEIKQVLNIAEADTLISGFERPNLSLEKVPAWTKSKERYVDVLRVLEREYDRNNGVAMVYCPTVSMTEEIYENIKSEYKAERYYSTGMTIKQRKEIQENWMAGEYQVLVCTNAFGMGIDKPNVRCVIHANLPASIEAYYQEAGRAGRDLNDSKCILLYNSKDIDIQQWFIDGAFPPQGIVESCWDYFVEEVIDPVLSKKMTFRTVKGEQRVYAKIEDNKIIIPEVDIPELSKFITTREKYFVPYQVASALLRILTQAKVVKQKSSYGKISLEIPEESFELETADLPVDWQYLKRRRKIDMDLLAEMDTFAKNASECRQGYIVKYFDRNSKGYKCGKCDICRRK